MSNKPVDPNSPPVDGDDSDINVYEDGVVYAGEYWYVSFDFGDTEDELKFSDAEYAIDAEELADEVRERAEKHGRIIGGEFDARVESFHVIPEDLLDILVDAGYTIEGYEQDEPAREPQDWLYDGECPNCGDVLCIERLNQQDICYECGTEVAE